MTITEIISDCPQSSVIGDNLIIAHSKINSPLYKKAICSISGGSDSDLMLDICTKVDNQKKIQYVWFDTGLEYQATKDHLKYLEERYGIEITPYKAKMPIPLSNKKYGQPFLSKAISDYIYRLQKFNFKWEDKPFDELYEEYPKCKAALRWWCNEWGIGSRFNISYHRYLKEFMVLNPPQFKISNLCCKYAKKDVAHKCIKDQQADLNIYGVRKAEGGARSSAYKSCFSTGASTVDEYRPLFWYKDEDKRIYEEHYEIVHSKCYTEYGLKRTGCAGCPFGQDFEQELKIIEKYEPKLFTAVNNIFGDSYEYTRKYREFVKEMKKNEKENVKCQG